MKQTERKGTLRNIKWQTLIGGSSGYWTFVIGSSNPRTGFICVKYIFSSKMYLKNWAKAVSKLYYLLNSTCFFEYNCLNMLKGK